MKNDVVVLSGPFRKKDSAAGIKNPTSAKFYCLLRRIVQVEKELCQPYPVETLSDGAVEVWYTVSGNNKVWRSSHISVNFSAALGLDAPPARSSLLDRREVLYFILLYGSLASASCMKCMSLHSSEVSGETTCADSCVAWRDDVTALHGRLCCSCCCLHAHEGHSRCACRSQSSRGA